MANITKRTNRRAAAHLGGERADVVLLCEMKGVLGVGAVPTVLSTLTTEWIMKRRTGARLEGEGGIASSFPASTTAVAVTPTRVLAMPSNGINFAAPTLVVERDQVCAETAGRRGLGTRLVLTFADGTQAEVDVMPGQPLKEFVALLGPG